MPSSNLDLVRSIYAAWERGHFSSVEWAHPAIVFESIGFDSTTSTGVAEMGQRWREWVSTWEDYRSEAEAFASSVTGVFEVRDGKVTRLALYWERADALAELGLEE